MTDVARSSVIPTLRYRDAPAAIGWLCDVLGFARRLVVPGEGGTIAHAQLVLGGGMVMVGSVRDDAGEAVAPPGPEGLDTRGVYVAVDDPDAVHERAVAAGAEIVEALQAPEYGGRFFACRDPEGRVWSVGSYDPWADDPPE